ncbi:MAG: MerR family DNA-binding transcriptional regulator [Actinobacteria bacterium]|nr:MerR family DNA-binding transcriptional regulator [Actinomycetota bacterium]
MQIGEVARRARVAASTIRFYEQAGILPEPAAQLPVTGTTSLRFWKGFHLSERVSRSDSPWLS